MKKKILCSLVVCAALMFGSCRGADGGFVYVNDEFDLGFTPIDSMVMSTEEELAAVAEEGIAYEMMATVADTQSAVVVTVQEDLYGGAKAYLESVRATLSIEGYNIAYGEVTPASVAGEEYYVLKLTMSYGDHSMNMATYARSDDKELLLINMSYTDEAELIRILGCFSEFED